MFFVAFVAHVVRCVLESRGVLHAGRSRQTGEFVHSSFVRFGMRGNAKHHGKPVDRCSQFDGHRFAFTQRFVRSEGALFRGVWGF